MNKNPAHYKKHNSYVLPESWRVGEVYYLAEGTSPFILRGYQKEALAFTVEVEYLSMPGKLIFNRHNDKLCKAVLIEEAYKGEYNMADKLYQIKDADNAYGIYLTKNSQGQYVLEMKQGGGYTQGQVAAFNKDALDEVMPYTVAVQFKDGGQSYHFFANQGDVEVGDLIVRTDSGYEGNIAWVTKLDTKSRQATKQLSGIRIKGEKIGG